LIVKVTPPAQSVRPGANATFTAQKAGQDPVQYQWQFNGQNLTAGPSLTITNVQLPNEGHYRVVAANSHGAVTSAPVQLVVLINPAVVARPLDQRAIPGDDATFSFMISGNPPPFGYFLRRSSNILASYVTDERTGFLSLLNVQSLHAGTYRVVVTNAANPAGLIMDPVALAVVADGDANGLPDEWEAQFGGEPGADPDQDGLSNRQEYLAGTGPLNAQSSLRLRLRTPVVLEFDAASNKTYTVQWRGSLGAGSWARLADFIAAPTNRTVAITNTAAGSAFYRLVTPRTP